MRYDVLGRLATQNRDVAQRLNVYLAYDAERAMIDGAYRNSCKNYHNKLRGFGFKVIIKEVKTFNNSDGTKTSKSNADMELAVDLLLQSDKLDRIILGTGDGDFVRVISALQDKGLRVDVLAFRNCSKQLIETADCYMSGYLIPELIPNPYFCQNPNYSVVNSQALTENEIQMTGIVAYTNIEKGISAINYLTRAPGSFLDTDSAWEQIEVNISKEDISKHTMMRGNVVSWLANRKDKKPLPNNHFVRLSN